MGSTNQLSRWQGRAADALQGIPGNWKEARSYARVLVIDDEPDILLLCRFNFTQAGREVVEAGGGAEGVVASIEDAPSVIVLDVMMPDVDGFAVLHALRSDRRTRDIPVLVPTAKVMAADHEHCFQLGAGEVMAKPFHARRAHRAGQVPRGDVDLAADHERCFRLGARGHDEAAYAKRADRAGEGPCGNADLNYVSRGDYVSPRREPPRRQVAVAIRRARRQSVSETPR